LLELLVEELEGLEPDPPLLVCVFELLDVFRLLLLAFASAACFFLITSATPFTAPATVLATVFTAAATPPMMDVILVVFVLCFAGVAATLLTLLTSLLKKPIFSLLPRSFGR
jgi:hypothetical protein